MEDQDISIFPERTIAYGTFWQRFAAAIIDLIILSIPGYIIQRITGGRGMITDLMHTGTISNATYLTNAITLIMNWLYMAGMQSGKAQASIGKMALGLTVTDVYGNRISFAKASGRFFAEYLSTIILCIGYFMVLWDDKSQALHDKLAGTLVVTKQAAF